jgi:hypothetical protein
MRLSTKSYLVVAGLTAATALSASPAFADDGGPGGGGQQAVTAAGHCTSGATWTLKGKPDDGRIEAEFEVDGIVKAQTWHVVLRDNGTTFLAGTRTAAAGNDSFTVSAQTANRAGTDTIVGRARNNVTGQVCRGSVNL